MASNGHFNIRFCTVTVNIYRFLKRNYGIGDQSFRTVTVDIYQSKQKYITNKLLSFRTVSVDIYPLIEVKQLSNILVFVQYLLIFICWQWI